MAISHLGGGEVTDCEIILDTLVSVLRKYHPHSPLCESALRHWSDIDLIELLHSRILNINLDMGSRGTSSTFWKQLELSLRPVLAKKSPAWDELPRSVDELCRQPVRGTFTGETWEDIFLADEALKDTGYIAALRPNGLSRREENPSRMKIERRGRDSE